jgi:hypothetical protein
MLNPKKNDNDESQLELGLSGNKQNMTVVPRAADTATSSVPANTTGATAKVSDPVKPTNIPEKKFPPSTAVSIGEFLLDSRTRADLSLNQVSAITKIHIHYLEAMECEDFKTTPPFTYVRAYVKKLCELYGVDADYGAQLLTPHFKASEGNVPETVIQNLEENKQVDVKHEAKVNFFVKVTLISVLSAAVLIVSICFFSMKGKSTPNIVDRPLNLEEKRQLLKDMERLIAPQAVPFREIKTPVKSGR